MKVLFKFILFLFSFLLNFYLLASSAPEGWFVAGANSADSRRMHLAQQYMAEGRIGTTSLVKYGKAFAYDGPADNAYIQFLKERSQQENLRVLIPAFGVGRTVLDTLATHPTAVVLANEIQESGFQTLHLNLNKYSFDLSRVKNLRGDIETTLDEIEAKSLDAVYIANLFHFFSPEKIRRCLLKIRNCLKENGRAFIIWRGSSVIPYKIPLKASTKSFQMEKKFQEDRDIQHPFYMQGQVVSQIVRNPYVVETYGRVIFPYNNANWEEMFASTCTGSFECESSGQGFIICAATKCPHTQRIIPLGDYKVEAFLEDEEPSFPNYKAYPILCHLILKPLSDEACEEARCLSQEEEKAFYKNRKEDILLKALDLQCAHCLCIHPLEAVLTPCPECESLSYCSEACRKADNKEHKKHCERLRKITDGHVELEEETFQDSNGGASQGLEE